MPQRAPSPSLQRRIIGAKIRHYRENTKGWTQKEFADELNRLQDDKTWTPSSVHDKESGRSSLPSEHLSFFAMALGVTEAELRDPRIPETDLTERLDEGHEGPPDGPDGGDGICHPTGEHHRHYVDLVPCKGDGLVPHDPAHYPLAHAA